MRTAVAALATLALTLGGCGGAVPELPADPIQKAATCGVVAAANARAQVADISAPLPLAGQGAVLRHALVTGAEGESFDAARAAAVVKAMPTLGETLDEKAVKTLAPLCTRAFPAPAGTVALPDDPLTAALGCDELGDYMRRALEAQAGDYKAATDQYFRLNQALDSRLPSLLSARGLSNAKETQPEADKAMATIVKLGEPSVILDACTARFVKG